MKPAPAIVTLLLIICMSAPALGADGKDAVLQAHTRLEKAAEDAGTAGKQSQKWLDQREELLNEARQLLFDIQATRFAADRQETYINSKRQDIAEVEARLAEADKTRLGLEPLMEALYEELAASIDASLPFALDERRMRLANLRRTLDDPDAQAGDKLGRLLEALRIETEYGLDLESEEVVMERDNTPMRFTVLRVGRLALLRIPPTADSVERFDPPSESWKPVPEGNGREVLNAIRIARKQRMAEMVQLPVGSASQLSSIVEKGEQ